MPDRTRISTRTWAGILVTHGVYYENSCYPVVLGLEVGDPSVSRNRDQKIDGSIAFSPVPRPDISGLEHGSAQFSGTYEVYGYKRSYPLSTSSAAPQGRHMHSVKLITVYHAPSGHTALRSHISCHELADARTQSYTRTLRSRYLREYSYSSLATRQFVRPDLARQLASTHPDADTRSSPVQLVQGWLQTGP
ncbi:hypothetical protein M431DRAFT_477868 [Trichoderma harzianum CBS 226.95]|uniref:Uncharacterized protein n=1 Tax=Trichoderma harzianum CBS 226.95 TaxID=983964 RepID=A0A2T4ANN1_TRIHA|nr:hypothetical protein M431DRAFT_477868 [Trichoderma harzianum CBS 226.95]PTB58684.1 hypothetical protein M431DRAFT_477868 [Trichoderma harzianum CBS 226.95]